jgi:hypothetical protein
MIRPGHLPLVLVASWRSTPRGAAEAHGHAEPLRAPHGHVRAPLAGRRQQRQRQQVRRTTTSAPASCAALDHLPVVVERAVGGRVLEQDAEDVVARAPTSGGRPPPPPTPRPSPASAPRRWSAAGSLRRPGTGHRPLRRRLAQRHGLRRRRGLVQERRVGDLQPRQVDDHGLEDQQRLQPTLARSPPGTACTPCTSPGSPGCSAGSPAA